MTPSQRARHACEGARDAKWRKAAPQVPTLKPTKHCAGPPQAWPIHPHPKGQSYRSSLLPPAPHLPLFHTRHAEESAERPRLVTIVRPCGQSTLRKVFTLPCWSKEMKGKTPSIWTNAKLFRVTVLLNRRGVVSFEQLLLDVSEALGFPRWHRARVTRLYTTHAREIKGVCDFFRGEVAFVALGKARPELSAVQEALEELFPLHTHHRAAALQAWERRLRPAPDKAAKADSGYSEGTDGSEMNQETHREKNTRVNNHTDRHTTAQPAHHSDIHKPENSNTQKCYKKSPSRKPVVQPNHLQRLHVRRGVKEPSVIGLLRHDVNLREADAPSPTLCENCLVRRANHQVVEGIDLFSGRVPLPPVSKKQKERSNVEQEVRRVQISPPSPQPISREEDKSAGLLRLSDPLQHAGQKNNGMKHMTTFDPILDSSAVTLEDIECRYDIGHVVGDGNFAVVRQCRRRQDGRTLAVKIVERCKLIGREHMMQNELSLLGSLCHPRIVRLFAHHHTHTHSYLVMELVSGGDLFEAISERGKFSEAEAALMVSDVSEALNYIHCKSIVHRDIKPENLLIERDAADICRLKLGDFGLAMVVTEPVFTICGTPTYVAPEILCETGYGVAVDVWALGVILYILLCGFPPFRSRDRDQEELFQLIKQGQLHFLSPYWDTISEGAKGLVKGLIQPDPTVRLTAEQTLLHPWVKDMALLCRQRALSVKTQVDTACDGAEGDRVQSPAQIDAPQTMGQHTGSKGEMTQSELATPVAATPGQQRPGYTPRELSRPEIQHPDPEFLNKDHDPGIPTNLHVDNKLLTDPLSQTNPPSQIKTQSKQVNQQQSPPRSPPSTAEKQQTTAGQPTLQHPSSNPTTVSSSHSVHQQDISSLSPL